MRVTAGETIIPNTDPGRALQLMQMTGLDKLVASQQQQGGGTNFNGPLISMPGACRHPRRH